jgi:hypothetical protein
MIRRNSVLGFSITHAELLRADAYEADDYKRVEVRLKSGRQAWVYIRKDDQKM